MPKNRKKDTHRESKILIFRIPPLSPPPRLLPVVTNKLGTQVKARHCRKMPLTNDPSFLKTHRLLFGSSYIFTYVRICFPSFFFTFKKISVRYFVGKVLGKLNVKMQKIKGKLAKFR